MITVVVILYQKDPGWIVSALKVTCEILALRLLSIKCKIWKGPTVEVHAYQITCATYMCMYQGCMWERWKLAIQQNESRCQKKPIQGCVCVCVSLLFSLESQWQFKGEKRGKTVATSLCPRQSRAQMNSELCESRGGRPGLPLPNNLMFFFLWTQSTLTEEENRSKAAASYIPTLPQLRAEPVHPTHRWFTFKGSTGDLLWDGEECIMM